MWLSACVPSGKGAQLQIRGTWSAGPGDDEARFLADLRALRDVAAIGYDELAARAHFPSNILKEAENGPLLPGLPILTAYVRACEGDVPDWEERWRRLASEVPEDPGLPVRPPGASPAAVAGARAGVGVAPPDVYDPDRIRAALRGGHQRSDQGGRKASGPGWEVASDPTKETVNGNHTASPWNREPFDGAVGPDPAEGAEQAADFHWLPDHGSGSWSDAVQADTGPDDAGQADTGWPSTAQADTGWASTAQADTGWPSTAQTDTGWPSTGQADTGWTDTAQADTGWTDTGQADTGWAEAGQADTGQAAPADVGGGASAEPAAQEWTPRYQDEVLNPPERTDFWATSATSASADVQLPATAPYRVEEQEPPLAAWPSSAETTATSTPPAWPGISQRTQQPATDAADNAGFAAAGAPLVSAEATGPAGFTGSAGLTGSAGFAGSTEAAAGRMPATEHGDQQKDRLFPARLLAIIIIAALIGSALVLLLR